ncbi:MAG TPA: neutral zinc metallopeptidase [Geminicoccaceae bacterium]|nr:neutral zinc metallopeptidase [Geminicoccaceae bacterium]
MRWRLGRRSTNIEDRRGMGAPIGMRMPRGMPGGMRMPGGRAGRAGGLGGIGIIIVALIAIFLGVDPSFLFQGGQMPGPSYQQQAPVPGSATEEELKEFVSAVLADTEDTWHGLFEQIDRTYQEPVLVLFSGEVESACGYASAAVGPFYCPGDRQVYIDLAFFEELDQRFGAPGDFAQAYVLAHEVGHHVQTLLGISDQVRSVRATLGEAEANALSVRQELQADCFAGIWAYHAERSRQMLEDGDIDEGLTAASAIGDDRLQRQAQGYVVPESFTHGSSAQRVRWFRAGYDTGMLSACDTFSADPL